MIERMETKQVLKNGFDIYKWLTPMREHEQAIALKHIQAILYNWKKNGWKPLLSTEAGTH